MTTTLANMVVRIQAGLDDSGAATWSTVELGEMLNDAIRDYSVHFPRILTATVDMITGTAEYDLPVDFMGVLSVEYPAGEDPREYLKRRPYTEAGFWESEYYYDIIPTADDDDNEAQLVMSPAVATDEDAIVEYHAHHQLIANTSSIAGDNTVPPQHQHLLIKYAQWQAALFLATAEQKAPTSNSSLLMAQLAQNARRLELSYSTALQQAIYADEGKSRPINWISTESGMERIY